MKTKDGFCCRILNAFCSTHTMERWNSALLVKQQCLMLPKGQTICFHRIAGTGSTKLFQGQTWVLWWNKETCELGLQVCKAFNWGGTRKVGRTLWRGRSPSPQNYSLSPWGRDLSHLILPIYKNRYIVPLSQQNIFGCSQSVKLLLVLTLKWAWTESNLGWRLSICCWENLSSVFRQQLLSEINAFWRELRSKMMAAGYLRPSGNLI